MIYRILADAVIAVHLAFIAFVVLGGLLALRWPRLAWLHVPAFLWGGGIEIAGQVCPLTYLENRWRTLGAEEGYSTSFVEHYVLPVIYPQLLFPGGFPRQGFIVLGITVLAFNAIIYWRLVRHRRGRD
jgi:hypothetical protein